MSEGTLTPEELVALAAARGVAATLHRADQPMPTVEDAAEALGVPLDEMTKNVVFVVVGQPVLAIAAGAARVDRRALAAHFGVGQKKVKLATPEQTLAATGFEAGCVPPFGHRAALPTFIDEAVLRLPRVFGGTREPTALISVPSSDLVQLTGGTVLRLTIHDQP